MIRIRTLDNSLTLTGSSVFVFTVHVMASFYITRPSQVFPFLFFTIQVCTEDHVWAGRDLDPVSAECEATVPCDPRLTRGLQPIRVPAEAITDQSELSIRDPSDLCFASVWQPRMVSTISLTIPQSALWHLPHNTSFSKWLMENSSASSQMITRMVSEQISYLRDKLHSSFL